MPEKLLYEGLTDKIIATCFKVYNQFGYGYPEKIYQKAIELEFQDLKIPYKRQQYSKIFYGGKIAGRFFLDFLLDDKVALEVKVRRNIYESDWIQLLNYLKSKDLRVGILAVFTRNKVEIKRVINQIRV